jgi:hypothetical protein
MLSADKKFAVCWILCGIGGFLFFQLNRNGGLKRRLFPWYCYFLGIILLIYYAMRTWRIIHDFDLFLLLLCPAVIIVPLIALMNVKKTKFCLSCGMTIHTGGRPLQNGCCPKCSSQIE